MLANRPREHERDASSHSSMINYQHMDGIQRNRVHEIYDKSYTLGVNKNAPLKKEQESDFWKNQGSKLDEERKILNQEDCTVQMKLQVFNKLF